jgi:hypothetical protein
MKTCFQLFKPNSMFFFVKNTIKYLSKVDMVIESDCLKTWIDNIFSNESKFNPFFKKIKFLELYTKSNQDNVGTGLK